MKNNTYFILHGLLIWLLATILYLLAGNALLTEGSFVLIMSNYLLGILVATLLTLPFYQGRKFNPVQQKQAVVFTAVPGMLMDSLSSAFFREVFPKIDFSIVNCSGACLVFGYTLILLSGWVPLARGTSVHEGQAARNRNSCEQIK